MERETAEDETFGAAPDATLAAEDERQEADELRMQRLHSMLLARERQRLAMAAKFGIERLALNLSTAFTHSVGLRFMAIRQRHRASVSRLLLPAGTSS